MAYEFKLPDIGEGIHEGEIVSWLVKEGDTINEDDPMVEVMTDKATVEIPSPKSGTVLKLNGEEGEVVNVGDVIVVIGEEGESAPESSSKSSSSDKETQSSASANGGTSPAASDGASSSTAVADKPAPSGRVLATPATRKLAREMNIDIKQVEGTGPAGRVTDDDVKNFASGESTSAPTTESQPAESTTPSATPATAQPSASSPATETPQEERIPEPVLRRATGEPEERMPLRGVRRVISDHMHHSVSTHAHFTYVDEVDVTELVKVRSELKEVAGQHNIKLSYLPFIIKATIAALKKHPYLNASADYEKEEIILKNYYNIGMAAATDQGLVVPVIKAADQLSMLELASEIERLGTLARNRKLAPEDLQGSTFTITSLGAQGGFFATPIINSPDSAILGIHEMKKRPWVVNNEITIRDIMLIALSFDHRLIDGHVGAAFAKDIKAFLEDPKWLLLGA